VITSINNLNLSFFFNGDGPQVTKIIPSYGSDVVWFGGYMEAFRKKSQPSVQDIALLNGH
jgi:hypothetical protein